MGLIEKFEQYLALQTPEQIDRIIFRVKQFALAEVEGYAVLVDVQPEDNKSKQAETAQAKAERLEQAKIIEDATAQARDLFHKLKVKAMAEEMAAESLAEWRRDRAAFQQPLQPDHDRIASLFQNPA